jgi:hypothetical protein
MGDFPVKNQVLPSADAATLAETLGLGDAEMGVPKIQASYWGYIESMVNLTVMAIN